MAAKSWSLLTPVVDALKNAICGLIRDVKEHLQIAAGFYAEAQSTPDKTIAIYAGIVYFGITKVEYVGLDDVGLGTSGAYEVSALTADYYNKILFTIDSSGTLAATEGTEHAVAASVVAPAIPAGKFPICMVTVQDDGTGTAGTILTIEQSEIQQLQALNSSPGGVTNILNLVQDSRSQFAYSDADQITCAAAQYMCKDKYCHWVSTLTTGATGAAGGADWWYLYLDYSAITSGTAITASELIWSVTEPTWNTTYRQWMNGDDRCIFAVRTTAGNSILEFFHNEDFTLYADGIEDFAIQELQTDWSDEITLTVPIFVRRVNAWFQYRVVDGDHSAYWRTEGQTGTTGHKIGNVVAAGDCAQTVVDVICSANLKIDVKESANLSNTLQEQTNGWYFPTGM